MKMFLRLSGATALSLSLSGCILFLHPQPPATPPTKVDVIARPSEVPPGVARYCWKEPKVVAERNGPGLNAEGTWYLPAQTDIREVKQGYWVECETGKRVEMK